MRYISRSLLVGTARMRLDLVLVGRFLVATTGVIHAFLDVTGLGVDRILRRDFVGFLVGGVLRRHCEKRR